MIGTERGYNRKSNADLWRFYRSKPPDRKSHRENFLRRTCTPLHHRLEHVCDRLMGNAELANAKAALLVNDVHITGQERSVLLDMASATRTGEIAYEFGWDRLAGAIGKMPGTKAAERALERVTLGLRNKGLITRTRPGGNGRTARYELTILAQTVEASCPPVDNSVSTPVDTESCPPLLEELPPTSEQVAPHSEGGVSSRGSSRGRGEAPPTCEKHPDGWHHDEPCRTCGEARRAAAAKPTVSQMVTVQPGQHCAPLTHRLMGDGTCLLCDKHREDIHAEATHQPALVG